MIDLKFSEIIKLNNEYKYSLHDQFNIGIISNISIQQIKPIIEYSLRYGNINAICNIGEYDNILQDTIKFVKHNLLIYFWESCNFTNGFHYEVNLMNDTQIKEFIKVKISEINYIFENTKTIPIVIFNLFSSSIINRDLVEENNFDKVCNILNKYITENKPANFILINIDKIFMSQSIKDCVDFRNYYSTKTLYTISFLKSYTEYINPIVKSLKGFTKKCLVLDCDNTIWNGIIGEDKIDGIQMSKETIKGSIYYEIQNLIKVLHNKGILIALNSKNNIDDVLEVFDKNESIFLKSQDIILKKVNWNEKSNNINEIAEELNIGLDSIVFVDDSDFEINLIERIYPEVHTLQVNTQNLYNYPSDFRRIFSLFYQVSSSKDDLKRNKMYLDNLDRTSAKDKFNNFTDYLQSLNIEINIFENDTEKISRISQLSQKTNQFNFTTKRYTENEISNFMSDSKYEVISISANDIYGDLGTISVIILHKINDICYNIDTFLMSCRAIGRNIEIKILNEVISYLKQRKVEQIISKYVTSNKNNQIEYFYDNNKFLLKEENGKEKIYSLDINKYIINNISYIKSKFHEK